MDNAFKVVVVNTLNWIALCNAMSGALVTVEETPRTTALRPRSKKTRTSDSAFAKNVVRFPGPVARRKAARPQSGRRRTKRGAEILVFPPRYSA